jgi:hypothetical protein
VEHRRKRAADRNRRVKKLEKDSSAVGDLSLPYIADLIGYGEITIGVLRPVGCVATAADEDCTYAMLVRRRGETLTQLLARLDEAIEKAFTQEIFTDEING